MTLSNGNFTRRFPLICRATLKRRGSYGRLRSLVQRIHEINYRLIVGSQLALMLKANTQEPTTVEKARAIYDAAKQQYPEIYQNFTFEAWSHWPVMAGLLRTEQPPSGPFVYKITPAGRDFLHYLVDNSLTTGKFG